MPVLVLSRTNVLDALRGEVKETAPKTSLIARQLSASMSRVIGGQTLAEQKNELPAQPVSSTIQTFN